MMRSRIIIMRSDDMPPNGCEGAKPQKEEAGK